jgi:RNA polymerase sigma-70 factor (ECF subfamily)
VPYSVEPADINGWPAMIIRVGGQPFSVLTIETDGERIYTIHQVLNPEKLTRL